MNTVTGYWTVNKNYPYFPQLKELFEKKNITYIDLDEHKIRNVEALNYIKKCKVYLGLDTGMSNYASAFANGKGYILQSGFNSPNFWSIYDYEYIMNLQPCSSCFLRKSCPNNNVCMEIPPEEVLNRIKNRLDLRVK